MSEIGDAVSWTERLEKMYVASGEKAYGLSVLHKRAEAEFSYKKTFIELPVIIGSAVIGFLNAGSTSMFDDQKIASVCLGVGSLIVGVLQTTNTYFGWAKRSEGHRIASIQYSKLFRFLNMEMALPRNERLPPNELFKQIKDTYDRLQEISPLIPPRIIAEFKRQYATQSTSVAVPEECNGLEKIEVFVDGVRSSSSAVTFSLTNPLHKREAPETPVATIE